MLSRFLPNRRKKFDLPIWGGDHRTPIVSPLDHHRTMARYEVISTTLRTMSLVFAIFILIGIIATIPRMTTVNYVSDGSRFGCIVEPFQGGQKP